MARLPLLLESGVPTPAASCGFYFPFWFKSGCGAPTPVIEIIDTHDGERKRKRWEEQRRAKEQLREQILAAFDAELEPPELADIVELARPGPEPIVERVDLDLILADIELLARVRNAAAAANERRRQREQDEREREDEELALLLLL